MEKDHNMELEDNVDEDDEMGEDDSSSEDENETQDGSKKVYLPGDPLNKDEELVCDESVYVMLHQCHSGAPCLSFDIVPDELGESREEFPLTSYLVAGTQAARTHVNNVIVMKMYNLSKTQKGDDDDGELSDSENEGDGEDESKKPKMSCAFIRHQGCVNRIRTKRIHNTVFAATWSELGRVNIWNLNDQLQAVDDANILKKYEKTVAEHPIKPIFTFSGHQQEGYGLDWNPIKPGVLATGDCKRDIHVWEPLEDGTWKVDQRPLVGHTDSVEDLQWSPNEKSVLASCSVDKTIRIWDCRAPPQKACMLTCENAHESDVNVISWNRNEPFIASGGDDGVLHIWDLRQFAEKKPIATFKHHTNHITTVEWYQRDSTILATGGADNQLAIWDLAVEKDLDEGGERLENEEDIKKLPPQLLFIHQGQQDIKELHWHPQLPGVIISTAHSGFDVFRTISV